MTFTKLPKAISAEELLSTPLPPVKWIIPGLLPAGLALFAGPSKAGKSWLTLWLCLQIAQGNPVWNREIEPRTVIYFSLEDTFNRLQSRIFQLIDGGDAPERLILQTECPSIGQGLEEQVEALVHTYHDVGLIVIDTLQKVRLSDGNGGMYANDYKEAGALKKIADKYGICILLIHHLRKQTATDPFDQISGSTGLMGVADTSWVMQRKRMSQTAGILLTGRDMDDRTLHLREENCIWTLEDEETAEEREIKAVPDYLWKAAKYIESVGNWQGTASELLSTAGIENAKPNQFTYNMAKYFDKVFEPKNIRYKTHRKNKVRLLNFYGDDGDGGDDDIDITQLSGWGIPERPSPSSPSSLGALEGSKDGLQPVERTVIDRCVRQMYREHLQDPETSKMPTLQTLYDLLCSQPEGEAVRLATALEIYVSGSLNVFNHETNVDLNRRLVCLDLKKLGAGLRTIAMLIMQDLVNSQVSMNFLRGIATWCYFDEFHVLLRDRLTASYCVAIWKMLRKKGCVPSALTQNVKDFLASPEIENIFENSDFLVLLSQAQGDRQILAKQLGISPHQLSYVTHTNSGEGLLFFGNTTIPFVDRFPQNTELYAIMTTRPEDKKQEMNRA